MREARAVTNNTAVDGRWWPLPVRHTVNVDNNLSKLENALSVIRLTMEIHSKLLSFHACIVWLCCDVWYASTDEAHVSGKHRIW